MIKIDDKSSTITFSSGRSRYCNTDTIGLGTYDGRFYIGYGRDGSFRRPDPEWMDAEEIASCITDAECAELAEYMIARWQAFRATLTDPASASADPPE